MNKVQRQRWESRKLLSPRFNNKSNVVKLSCANTFEHELTKFLLCWELLRSGKEFVTEAIFDNGKRADIFVLDDEEAYEVLHSETTKRFNEKVDSYPCFVTPFDSAQVIEKYKEVLCGK